MTTADIVCTTIGDGSFLKHYAAALAGAEDRARIIVIPDRRTPAALYAAVAETRAAGIRVECPDLNEQEQFLASLGAPAAMFPFDTDHRRNIGYLMAWRDGADIMISVDDDNLPGPDGKWLTEHIWILRNLVRDRPVIAGSGDPWFWNPFSMDEPRPPLRVWPRGFPYAHRARWSDGVIGQRDCEVTLNQGMWRGDPDVDAITRIALRPRSEFAPGWMLALGPDAWAPVNSQNTAIRREVIPAYYFFRSGRFGDIYQGYLAEACAKAMGHAVSFGTPVADCSVRNDHDLLRDLQLELPDILILDRWLDWLTAQKPGGGSYAGAYESLSHALNEHAADPAYSLQDAGRLHYMASDMRRWLTLIRTIGA